jgi:AcrR family transcriptional regulator
MTETTAAEPDLLEEAFGLIAERGWRDFRMSELARRAGVRLSQVYAAFPTRAAVLPALGRRLDAAMLDVDPVELAGMTPRERVFELIMRRLDAMAPFRAGLRALGETGGDVDLLAAACGNLGRATGWLVEAAEPSLGPLRRAAAGPVLGLVYARVVQVWLRDDTPDRADTMAELDRRLNQAEGLARWTDWLDGRDGGRREDPAAGETPLGDAVEGQGA